MSFRKRRARKKKRAKREWRRRAEKRLRKPRKKGRNNQATKNRPKNRPATFKNSQRGRSVFLWQVGFLFVIICSQMRKFLKPLTVSLAFLFLLSFNFSSAEEVNQNSAKSLKEELQKKLDNLDSQIEVLDSVIQQKRPNPPVWSGILPYLTLKSKKQNWKYRGWIWKLPKQKPV